MAGCAANRTADLVTSGETGHTDEKEQEWMDIIPERTGDDQSRYYHYLASQKRITEGDMKRAVKELDKVIALDGETPFLRREMAMYYLQQQNTDEALALLEKNIEQDPEDTESMFLYARALEILNRGDEARSFYERLITDESAEESVFLRLGDIYLEENDLDNAFRVYSILVEKYPDSYAGHFYLGKIYSIREEYDKAEEHIKQTMALLPGLEEPRYELADIYKRKGRIEDAIEIYRDVVENNADNIYAALELGILYHQNGYPEKARMIFNDIGLGKSGDSRLFRIIGQDYLDAERIEEAKVILEGVLETAAEKSGIYYLLGIALSGTGEREDAISNFLNVGEASTFYIRARIQAALLYQELGKLDDAIEQMNTVIEQQSDNQDLYMFLALFYEEKEAYENASKTFKEGLRLNEKNVQMNFRLGMVYDKMGERKKCIEQMKKVINLEPLHVNALNYLGYTYADMSIHLDEAEKMILTALKQKPDDGYITDSLGWVYYKKGDFEQAAEHLERAVQLVPDDPTIREHLGDLYNKMAQPQKALDAYRRSLMLNPENSLDIEKKIKTLLEENKEP
jgi:tetratricopeptide (TPR) repeat protein